MPLTLNIRHLERKNLRLEGELPVAELDLQRLDEMIRMNQPLRYQLEAQEVENGILVQGNLELVLECECVRCLKPFREVLAFPHWACHLPLQGEDRVRLVDDCVDLTPHIREDIVLALPQHPLCGSNCAGLPGGGSGESVLGEGAAQKEKGSSEWAALNKLKF